MIVPTAPGAADGARSADVAAALAGCLVATLADRPFVLTDAQLRAIGANDLAPGEEAGPYAHVVAGRYASLVADHVALGADMGANGAPGAYVRIWACARAAFLTSLGRSARGSAGAGTDVLPVRLARPDAPLAA
jgi:hypothetical protein